MLEAAVQEGHGPMAEPAQAPPGPASERAAGVVVDHDLVGVVEALVLQLRGQLGPVRQGVAAA